jgi:hypothetical protein
MTAPIDTSLSLGRSPNHPLPTLDWPGDDEPKCWWGRDASGRLTKVYRSYEDYCDD